MANGGLKFAINDSRVTRSNRRDVERFAELASRSRYRDLKPAESKQFARLQTQLHRQGVLVVLTREIVKSAARDVYASLPWWKKLSLRARYSMRVVRAWFEAMTLRLRP